MTSGFIRRFPKLHNLKSIVALTLVMVCGLVPGLARENYKKKETRIWLTFQQPYRPLSFSPLCANMPPPLFKIIF